MACLNLREKVRDIIAQGLDIHHLYKSAEERDNKVYAVSIGPNVYDAHTPFEHLSIPSTARTYEFLVKVLRESRNHDWEHKNDYSSQR